MSRFSVVRDEAVSPIIGVILMVAITVVVATVLFVLVRGFDSGDEPPPSVQFLRSNQDGRLTVIRTSDDIDLTNIEVRMSAAGHFAFNAEASSAATAAAARQFVPVTGTEGTLLQAGDFLAFCVGGDDGNISVDIRITSPPDVVLYQNSLTGLKSCA